MNGLNNTPIAKGIKVQLKQIRCDTLFTLKQAVVHCCGSIRFVQRAQCTANHEIHNVPFRERPVIGLGVKKVNGLRK